MSRREEASKLNSENIGPAKRVRPLPQALHVSSTRGQVKILDFGLARVSMMDFCSLR
jgi:hypothetical protein